MENPSPDQLDQMIEAIFVRCDKLREDNDLDYPGNLIGFTELVRLTFAGDAQGRAIFETMDEELLDTLFKLYDERRIKKQIQGEASDI